MATVCQIYDETNATVLFDLNDPTAANVSDNAYSSTQTLHNVDLGEPTLEFTRFTPAATDGGTTLTDRASFRTVKLPVRIRATSYDNLQTAVGKLAVLLRAGCVIRWQANTSSNVRYIDVEPSPAPFVLDGRDLSVYLATSQIDTPEGLTLELTCQPYLRAVEMDSASNLLTNATLTRDADGAGRPDGWSWSSTANITAEQISTTGEAFQFDIATAATRQLLQVTPNSTVVAGETWCMSGYARVTSASFTNCEIQAMIEYQTNAGAAVNTITGTLIPVGVGWVRIQVAGVASATATKAQPGLRVDMTSATAATIQLKNLQFEKTSAATPFSVGTEVGVVEPEPTSGMGRVFPFYNPGDAPAPVKLTTATGTNGPEFGIVGILEPGAYPGKGAAVEYLNTNAACLQLEDFTNGTDTAVNTDTDSSPGSGNTGKKTTFATITLTTRATLALTDATTLKVLRGRSFMVVLRFASIDAGYTGAFNVGVTAPFTATVSGSVNNLAVSAAQYVDVPLGVMTFPDDAAMTSISFQLQASRTAGTGNVLWDCITFVPMATIISHPTAPAATDLMVSDPRVADVYCTTAAGVRNSTMNVAGPVPFWAPPGLSMVYSMWGLDTLTVPSSPIAARTFVTTCRTTFAPRYLA
jgi:hypothetical protein